MNIDVFPFFNELELLKIRLTELWDVVDQFVAVEFSETYSGRAKQFFLATNGHVLGDLLSKLKVVSLDFNVPTDNPWAREAVQRDAIKAHVHPSDEDVKLPYYFA